MDGVGLLFPRAGCLSSHVELPLHRPDSRSRIAL